MGIIWALIIFGGVWDAADCIKLQRQDGELCVTVDKYDNRTVTARKCSAGDDDTQTWLWEGNKLKNKWAGKCFGLETLPFKYFLYPCSFVRSRNKSIPLAEDRKQYNDNTEFTRFGKHGLKGSHGKCLKVPGILTFDKCEEDKNDPYYE
jgi:hypothetical protein